MTESWLLFFKEMGRILSIDYGERRVGLAITDPTGTIARALQTIAVKSTADLIEQVSAIVRREEVTEIVVGLPRLSTGEEGEKAGLVRKFADALTRATQINCAFWDERFSTVSAKRMLLEAEERKHRRSKEKLDALAAMVILTDYLQFKSRGLSPQP